MQSGAALGRCRDRAGGGGERERGAVNTDWVGLWTKTGYFNNIDQQYSCLLRDQARPGLARANMESVENIEAWRAEISVDDDQWPSEPAIPHLTPHLPLKSCQM